MAERGDSCRESCCSDEEPTIAEDVVVTKYQMAADMANRKLLYCTGYFNALYPHIPVNNAWIADFSLYFYLKCWKCSLARSSILKIL